MSDKSLMVQCLVPGLCVEIRTKTGAKVTNLVVDRLDGDSVLLVGEHFSRLEGETPKQVVTKTYANPVVVSIDSIEAIKFVGKNY